MKASHKSQALFLTLAIALCGTLFYLKAARRAHAPVRQAGAPGATAPQPVTARLTESFGKLPLYFVENRGQLPPQAAYYVQGNDKAVYFTDQGLTFVLNQSHAKASLQPASYHPPAGPTPVGPTPAGPTPADHPPTDRYALKLDFIGASTDARPVGEQQTEAVISYFKGHPSTWKTGLKTYSQIVYRDLWPGIDLIYAGTVSRMKYSFVVRPGADPSQIKLAYRGASALTLNHAGALEVQTPAGGFNDDRPVSFQQVNGAQQEIPTAYALAADGTTAYGFSIGEYDRSHELVIDPAVFFYTGYLGGSGTDIGNAIAVDSTGHVYVTGSTDSSAASFPTGTGFGGITSFDNTFNTSADAFVVKINPTGNALVYAGYLGGSGSDGGRGIAVDSAGNAYICGTTTSTQATFPDGDGFGTITGPDLTFNGGSSDAFIAKVNAAGTALLYAGYIGGNGSDVGKAIAVDSTGNAYVTGDVPNASQAGFPDGDGFGGLTGPDTTFNGGPFDAYVVKVNAAGTALDYASFVGGVFTDNGNSIAVDSSSNVYLTGLTGSSETTFPDGDGIGGLPGPDTTYNAAGDAFVVKLNAAGTAFIYAGFIGGSTGDVGNGIAVDSGGSVYVTGSTDSTQSSFPNGGGIGVLPGPDTTINGGLDAFVAKINATGTAFVYAGYLGGIGTDQALGIALDNTGAAYVIGITDSDELSFPDGDGFGTLQGPDNTFNDGLGDAFVAKVNSAGSAFVYAGYVGGAGEDQGKAIAVDSMGNAYVTGQTDSAQSSFPNGNGFGGLTGPDVTFNGGIDAYVVKLSAGIVVNTTNDTVADDGVCSLREAIQAANTNAAVFDCPAGMAGLDTIQFNLGAGTPTINITSALPVITEPVLIDGATGGATRIELNGVGAGSNINGLQVQGGGSTIRSLVINRFSLSGIVIFSGNGSTVQDCYLGTNAAGTVDLGNGLDGIAVNSGNNLIGGTTVSARNVISGNERAGITFGFAAGTNNLVQGNYIGTAANGSSALGNTTQGILIDIGAINNTIGGTAIGAANLIAFNGIGVKISANGTTGNAVLTNSIFSNSGLGLDLGTVGVTPNDAGDPDTGPNNLQNFPVLNFVTSTGTINGSLDSTNAHSAYPVRIEFFANTACDGSGNGEGEVLLGSTSLGAPGSFNFTATLVPGKNFITATATDNNGNTSEFSACRLVNTIPTITASAPLSRQQGSAATNSQVATVADPDQALNTLTVQVNNAASATVNGVTVSNLAVSGAGVVTADVVASCAASNATFTLKVNDNASEINTANLTVNVTANTAPTLSYQNQTVAAGGSAMINPLTGPSDNGSINSLVVQNQGTYTGTINVNLAGVVSISNAAPVGTHMITIRATDNCGTLTNATFTLGVGPQTITVNTTADTVAADGFCSLREAITAANTNTAVNECPAGAPGLDNISFNIAGAGVRTINVTAALPTITQALNLDGYTQPGASANTLANGNDAVLLIELNGTSAGAVSGLSITGGSSTVRGLVINRFNGSGISITGTVASNNLIAGNFIGTNAAGTAALGNLGRGVSLMDSPNNTIGGPTAGARNLISGNGDDGIAVESLKPNAANGNTVQGNFVGVNAAGTAALANTDNGIAILSTNNCVIGGTAAGAGNLVSGNGDDGIEISGTSGGNNNQVQGNRIGVNASGLGALGNTVDGVHIFDNASGNTIGGVLAGAGNLIANNGNNGVTIDSPTSVNNALLGNTIFGNAQFGIDLGGDGLTANDVGDADTGANNLQNFPVLTAAIVVGGNTTMLGTFNSAANTTFRIEFFSSPACDVSGNGEGRVFLGFTNLMTDGSGNATINTTLAVAVTPGEVLTATATNPANNTSEFSACSAVTTCPAITVNPSNPTLPPGQAGQSYTQTFTQVSGNGAITWSVSAGAVPNGLTLNSATGLLSGTPVVFGLFNFTIRATDAINCTGERAYSLTINNLCATIAPANQTFAAAGGSGTVNVTGPGSCNWTAVSNAPWITVTGGGSGTGNGTVSYMVAASGSALPRTGTLTIANRTFYVNQVVPGQIISEDFDNGLPSTWAVIDGGSGGGTSSTWKTVNVADFCPTSANPLSPPFAGFVALANGSLLCVGNGSVQDEQLITPSFNATGLGRVLVQFLNQFRLDPNAGPTHTGDVDVSLDGGLNWINVLHQIADDGFPTPTLKTLDITNVVAANPGNVRIRFHYFGQISSLNRPTGGGEVIWPIDACHISFLSISPTSQDFNAGGGPGSVSVTVPAGEEWTAQSNAAWLTAVTTGGTGSGTANYSVAPNMSASPRSGTLTIAGNTFTVNQTAGNGLQFYPLPQPVRLLETRATLNGCTNPGAPLSANGTLTLPARTVCAGIPANAAAITGNVTVVPTGPGFLTLFPSTATQPVVANSNFVAGEITNNVFTVGLGAGDGAFKIFSSATTDVIVDVTGYYAPPGTGGLYFHPLPSPVRLLETRPSLSGCITPGAQLIGTGNPNADPNLDLSLQGRSPIVSPCNAIPAAAEVLVGNATSVLPTGGGYLTIYPSGGTRPTVASSNYAGADVINGPFTVKLGADGKFKIFTLTTTHLVVDILGYYSSEANDANGAGLLFNPLPSPVRLLETRPDLPNFPLTGCTRTNAPIVGNLNAATHTQMAANFCGLPAAAQAVVGNVSVVNTTGAGFLTLFPANLATAPLVATSNYPTPATFGYNRHYIVGLSPTDGKFKVLTQFTTDVILDASGYFAP